MATKATGNPNMVVIDGVKYEVLFEREFTLSTADMPLRQPATRVSLYLKRPRGKRTYHAVHYENGKYSSVV